MLRMRWGGGQSHIKVMRVHLLTHQIKGMSVTIFLQKRGQWVTDPKKWVIGGEITQNSGQNLFVLYAESKYTAMKHLQSTSTSTKILSKVVKR